LELLHQSPKSRNELATQLGQKSPASALKQTLRDLLDRKLIVYTIPDAPSNSTRKSHLPEPANPTVARPVKV
jgi:hypothetical protein